MGLLLILHLNMFVSQYPWAVIMHILFHNLIFPQITLRRLLLILSKQSVTITAFFIAINFFLRWHWSFLMNLEVWLCN